MKEPCRKRQADGCDVAKENRGGLLLLSIKTGGEARRKLLLGEGK